MPKARRTKKVEARRKREFTYRGFGIAELQAMSLEEFSKVVTARARRSLRRGFNTETTEFFERMRSTPKEKTVRTHCRDALVLPEHIGRHVAIHTGKEFKEIEIRPEMIGHYYGEFALTRRFEKHSGPGVGATRSSKFMPLK
jgi:small subunit ribosomal protein S19